MTHDETVEREKAKAVGHLLDMWEQYPNDERSCLMDPLRDALNSLMRAYEGRAALSAMPQRDELWIGDMMIRHAPNGIWIGRRGGEGGEFATEHVERVIAQFYRENF